MRKFSKRPLDEQVCIVFASLFCLGVICLILLNNLNNA